MSSDDSNSSSSPKFVPAHTRTLSRSHTRTLSSTHNVAVSVPAPLQTSGFGSHSQQLTSIPSELPQLMVTTPSTVYSANTAHSSSSSFGTGGTPYSPPMQVPDVPVPTIPEEYRQQPAIESGKPASPKQAASPHPSAPVIMLPSLVITSSTPPAQQARFASPMTANPNMPVLPKIATPGSANVARKPVAINTEAAAVARVKAGARSYSPPSKAPGNFTPTKPYGAGSISTMSPVAAARSFNARRGAPQQPSHKAAGSKESVDSPTVATASLYSSMKTQDRADISLSDRVVNKETLFDLDVDADATGEDAKELPLEDLMRDELPEYIQVYLTPHPDREQGSWGEHEKKQIKGTLEVVDEKAEIKDKEKDEYERRAAKWGDIEATLPAYKSTASLQRAAPFGRNTPSPPPGSAPTKNKKPVLRRCIPQKPTARILCIVILILALLVIPLVAFGVVYSLQHKGAHHDDQVAVMSSQNAPASGSPQAGVDQQASADTGTNEPPPIVAPMNNP
ncbi:hypothetical protein BKA62DRAFT_737472 [Auriculariales sp. MPI-PUGE-AT-0066]|nr:hypothetical protein BKA62DRAFT_737472 [Auriculariales sp. MPI-PUGE-AT-0066]